MFFLFKCYEIERLETFYNPLDRSESRFDDDHHDKYKNWKATFFNDVTKETWRKFAQLAWNISPNLAVYLHKVLVISEKIMSIQNIILKTFQYLVFQKKL